MNWEQTIMFLILYVVYTYSSQKSVLVTKLTLQHDFGVEM